LISLETFLELATAIGFDMSQQTVIAALTRAFNTYVPGLGLAAISSNDATNGMFIRGQHREIRFLEKLVPSSNGPLKVSLRVNWGPVFDEIMINWQLEQANLLPHLLVE